MNQSKLRLGLHVKICLCSPKWDGEGIVLGVPLCSRPYVLVGTTHEPPLAVAVLASRLPVYRADSTWTLLCELFVDDHMGLFEVAELTEVA